MGLLVRPHALPSKMTSGGWFSCKPCSLSDPSVDTVSVDPARLAAADNKENEAPEQKTLDPNEVHSGEKERLAREEQERRERQDREEAEEAAAVAAAAEAEEEERRAEARRQRALQEEELRRREEEELQLVMQASLEEERQREEEVRKQREAKEAEEHARVEEEMKALKKKVDTWLKTNGFADVKAKKKSMMSGVKYPLHKAVENKDAEMISALIKCGADTSAQNSKKQTALQLADKNNKAGSLDSVIAALTVRN